MDKLEWYVIWYPECTGWAVMKGEFRDSWYHHKYEAEQWCAYLNAKDDTLNGKVRGCATTEPQQER